MHHRTVVATFVSAALFSVPAAAQELSGTWELSARGGRGGQQTITLALQQEGSELTGTLSMTLGRRGGGGGPVELEIENGTVDGNDFGFTVTLTFGGNSITQTYSGTVDGDEMSGTIEGGRRGGRPFTGTRSG